jgi:hypothetical protein
VSVPQFKRHPGESRDPEFHRPLLRLGFLDPGFRRDDDEDAAIE